MHERDLTQETSTTRLEAFSDGVFAIAITLLVLEIRVPESATVRGDLATALWALWPSYFGYIFSFLMIGIYWVNHHYILKLYKKTDQPFLFLNVLFLMCVSFIPFPTAVLAKYIADDKQRGTAIFLYTLGLFLPAFAWLLKWLYATRKHRLVDRSLSQEYVNYMTTRFLITNVLYLLAVLLALWNGRWALAITVGLSLTYMVPSRKPTFVGDA
jgi:uncharacterized membrane protein